MSFNRSFSIVSLFIVTLFLSSVAHAQQTARDTLVRQQLAAAEKLAKTQSDLERARKIFEPYRLDLEYAKSAVLSAQQVVNRIDRMRQPLVDLAAAIAEENSAAADIATNPADPDARARLVQATKDREASEEAFDDILEGAEVYKDFAKKVRRRKSPEVALDELKVQYQKDLTKAEAKFTKEENRAAKAKKVFTDAEKATEEAARELAPIEAALAVDGLKDEVAGLRVDVKDLLKSFTNLSRDAKTKVIVETVVSHHYDEKNAERFSKTLQLLEEARSRENADIVRIKSQLEKLQTQANAAALPPQATGYYIAPCGQTCQPRRR